MKITTSKKLFAGAALALALGAGGMARASTNLLHGAECQPLYGPEVIDGQYVSHGYTGAKNLATNGKARLVVCPILRDQTGSTGGLTKLVVNSSLDTNFTGSTQCTGMVLTKFGSIKKSVAKVSATNTGTNSLTWTELNTSDNGSGSFAVQCSLPPGASLTSLEYQEP
jgi:hypothetical protein